MANRTEFRRRPPLFPDVDDAEEFDRLPATLYLPSRSANLGEPALTFELRETASGQTALPVYSSLLALVAGCGTGQSWVRLGKAELTRLRRRLGFPVIALDLAVPPELRHPELDATEFPDLPEIEVEHNPMDTVYVPARPFHRRDTGARLELQQGPKGEPALLAYFSPRQLYAACGPYQPWVAFPAARIGAVAHEAGARTVLFNPVLPEQLRHRDQVEPPPHRPEPEEEGSIYEW